MFDVTKFVADVQEYIERAVRPLAERLKQLESNPAPQSGRDGKDGVDGRDGKDGRDGVDGLPGKDGSGKDGAKGMDGLDGKDGKDGSDGRDAQVSYEELQRACDDAHERFFAKYALDFEIRASKTLQDVVDRIPMPRDGTDGVGFDDLAVTHDGEREFTLRFARGEQTKAFKFSVPVVIDRGYWRDGVKAQKGDAVTHEGTLWIALRDTDAKPSVKASEDWRIGARKGRDGVDGKNGKDAPAAVKLNDR